MSDLKDLPRPQNVFLFQNFFIQANKKKFPHDYGEGSRAIFAKKIVALTGQRVLGHCRNGSTTSAPFAHTEVFLPHRVAHALQNAPVEYPINSVTTGNKLGVSNA